MIVMSDICLSADACVPFFFPSPPHSLSQALAKRIGASAEIICRRCEDGSMPLVTKLHTKRAHPCSQAHAP